MAESQKNNLDKVIDSIDLNYTYNKKIKYGFMLKKSPNLEFEDCDITKYLLFNKYNNFILEFSNIFDEKFSPEEKNLFNRNIKSLKIKKSKLGILDYIHLLTGFGIKQGSYDDKNNTINIIITEKEEDLKSTIMHELLHMSSSKNEQYSGFSQIVKFNNVNVSIGHGINEGYTEKLNREIFSKVINHNVYEKEVLLASTLEKIIGKEKMQELYFNANLMGLVKELQKYEKDLDKLADLIIGIDKLKFEPPKIEKYKYEKLKLQIANIYKTKIDNELELGIIEKEYNKPSKK